MTSSRTSFDSSRRSDQSTTPSSPNSNTFTPISTQFEEKMPPNTKDQEQENEIDDPNPNIGGWPALAARMAATPEFASFSRFRELNIKSLLYYQAELEELQKKLHEIELKDFRQGDHWTGTYYMSANRLVTSDWEPDEPEENKKQWKLVKRIRVLLKQYSGCSCLEYQWSANFMRQTKPYCSTRSCAIFHVPIITT
jgi:hypothetical protein